MKNKILKGIAYVLGFILLTIIGSITYVKTALPNVGPAPEITIEVTPDRLAQGEYLANHVMVCIDCHSSRDWTRLNAPKISGTEGKGGEVFDQKMGFPGKYVSANITPSGIGDWTDGELFRAITTGVSKDGHALFNIMPYHNFGKCDQEDIYSIITYIRSLAPIENKVDPSSSDFPVSILINTIPGEAQLQDKPLSSDQVKYGQYLVTAASCYDCHTNQVQGQFIGEPFAGGMVFQWPDGSQTLSSNITPHSTGIKSWTKEQFVQRFKAYADSSYVAPLVEDAEFQSTMPWEMYAGMTIDDLEAMYAYLKTIDPVDNVIERYMVPSP